MSRDHFYIRAAVVEQFVSIGTNQIRLIQVYH